MHVFDFDGTLVDTPTPKDGMELYRSVTGQEWPVSGVVGTRRVVGASVDDGMRSGVG